MAMCPECHQEKPFWAHRCPHCIQEIGLGLQTMVESYRIVLVLGFFLLLGMCSGG